MDTRESAKRYFEIWATGIKKFPDTTSIHGFRFVADSKRHWFERQVIQTMILIHTSIQVNYDALKEIRL